ncbi:MAG: CDP-glucose 4,6-dehydratase [Bacteroidales bacterium]|nr:CDP-glucose 4,6-dehydratase [Bacteroidales bacterium]
MTINKEFWKGKRVLVTGHTGFKGTWLSLLLHNLGCEVYGFALEPPTEPSMFEETRVKELVTSHIGDVRNYEEFSSFVRICKPEIIIHMAAQPLVRESYLNPVETYQINVMGTVNLLEAVRHTQGIKALVNVTTDKCYENREWIWGYRENEPLGGYDPYSNSKGCSELITAAYRDSFFNASDFSQHGVAIGSARAGNVIGGGDWAEDRLIPDFIRSIAKGRKVKIRSPYSVRPWQHVLESLNGYLMLAERLYIDGPKYSEAWNFGPDDGDTKNVKWIVSKFAHLWGEDFSYEITKEPQLHEANYLKLDCSKAKVRLSWSPSWDLSKALLSTVEWYRAWFNKSDLRELTLKQINDYFGLSKK